MILTDPTSLRRFLTRHGISPDKGLGQHFLTSADAVASIVEACSGFKGILEIGPGPGVLTGPLTKVAERVIALELDQAMVVALAQSAPRAIVLSQDALQANLPELLSTLPEPRAVVSNLPYYITAPLLNRIAEAREGYVRAVLMMQKEVAHRVVAKPRTGERGSLSVYLQALFDIEVIAEVPAASFTPPPKVDSTVLSFTPIVGADYSAEFFGFVRVCFAMPRKTLTNNLVGGSQCSRDVALEVLEACGLTEKARAQELDLEQWLKLYETLEAIP